MNIAIVGYGRMGHEVERIITESSEHAVHSIHLRSSSEVLSSTALVGADVAIDFSGADAVEQNIRAYCQAGVPAVIGTTGWDTNNGAVRQRVTDSGIGIMVGSNFSAGVQVFLQIVRMAARQISQLDGYDVYGIDTHHRLKADSPSGTTKTIAQAIIESFAGKETVNYAEQQGQIMPETLHFASVRGGTNAGRHEIIFDSAADEIQLVHQAHDRSGFASGAVKAAEYIVHHPGFMYYEELFKKGGPYEPTI